MLLRFCYVWYSDFEKPSVYAGLRAGEEGIEPRKTTQKPSKIGRSESFRLLRLLRF